MDEEKKQSQFIKEKIVKRPMTPKEKGKRLLLFLLAALFFGAVAGTSFAVANYAVKQSLENGRKDTDSFMIPEDETGGKEETASGSESTEASSSAGTVQPESREQWQRQLERQASISLVAVQIRKKGAEPFQNVLEKEKKCLGAVIGRNGQEYLILVPWSPIDGAEGISVQFYNGSWAAASVKAKDTVTDIAVLSVAAGTVSGFGLGEPKPLSLGNSYQAAKGDWVLAVGSPFGILNTAASGSMLGSEILEDGIDSRVQVLYSNIGASAEGLGFLLDEEGNLIGLLTSRYSGTSDSLLTASVGISELKLTLSRLCQGNEIPYFGIRMQEIDKADSEAGGLPEGLYVTQVLQGSPAFEAGIQAGDIVISVDGKTQSTIKEFQNSLFACSVGDKVEISILRSGKGGYSAIEYTAVLGSR